MDGEFEGLKGDKESGDYRIRESIFELLYKTNKLERRIEQLEKCLNAMYTKIDKVRREDMLELFMFLEGKWGRKEMERLAKRYIRTHARLEKGTRAGRD